MKLQQPTFKVILLVLVSLTLVGAMGFLLRTSGPLAPVKVTVVMVKTGFVTPALFGIGWRRS
jgi:HlyD family secretion protein